MNLLVISVGNIVSIKQTNKQTNEKCDRFLPHMKDTRNHHF